MSGRRNWNKLGIEVEVVERNPADRGFIPQVKRWVVEQVNGIMMLYRRLVRDYEHHPASAESRVYWAMSDRMSRMLTDTSTPAWRGARPGGELTLGAVLARLKGRGREREITAHAAAAREEIAELTALLGGVRHRRRGDPHHPQDAAGTA
ncbi:hypothetical protein [Streptomyces boncukensis]|uniref:hypothetical protein n=1 Tax=Streptomyces boncukensis TaxID=2711219 RepID=UPI003B975417